MSRDNTESVAAPGPPGKQQDTVRAAADLLIGKLGQKPRIGLVLGTGLGQIARQIDGGEDVGFADVPGMAPSTAEGHVGRFVGGRLDGVEVLVQQGRLHLYEGKSIRQATLPIRIARAMGVDTLIVTNAAGGVNPGYEVGDLMLIEDHIDLMFRQSSADASSDRPCRGTAVRRPMYDSHLSVAAALAARHQGTRMHRGVYVAMLGPNYETRAEYRMCRAIGGDAVGMSTAPEVAVANQLGMRVIGISTITNVSFAAAASGHDVVSNAAAAAGRVADIVRSLARHVDAYPGVSSNSAIGHTTPSASSDSLPGADG